jgi:hypothetical protein
MWPQISRRLISDYKTPDIRFSSILSTVAISKLNLTDNMSILRVYAGYFVTTSSEMVWIPKGGQFRSSDRRVRLGKVL